VLCFSFILMPFCVADSGVWTTPAIIVGAVGLFDDLPVAFPKGVCILGNQHGNAIKQKTDVLQGTLALMVLKTLDVQGPQHGCGIARRIEQIGGDLLPVNQRTLYPVLLKLVREGAIESEWAPQRIMAGRASIN
jgi:hypothetical protein